MLFQIEHTTAVTPLDRHTFESFDALLIALSPAYVSAMQGALMDRFAAGVPARQYHADAEEEPEWID